MRRGGRAGDVTLNCSPIIFSSFSKTNSQQILHIFYPFLHYQLIDIIFTLFPIFMYIKFSASKDIIENLYHFRKSHFLSLGLSSVEMQTENLFRNNFLPLFFFFLAPTVNWHQCHSSRNKNLRHRVNKQRIPFERAR